MAISRTTLGSAIITSLFGRRLGLDKEDMVVAHNGQRVPSEDVSTTSGSSLSPYGISNLAPILTASSGAVNYTLQALQPGAQKVLALTSTTTAGVIVTVASGHYVTSTGASSGTTVSLYARTAMTLTQVSSIQMIIAGTLGSTATMAST